MNVLPVLLWNLLLGPETTKFAKCLFVKPCKNSVRLCACIRDVVVVRIASTLLLRGQYLVAPDVPTLSVRVHFEELWLAQLATVG